MTLERSGDTAILKSYFDYRGRGDSPVIHLNVRMPAGLNLDVEDGSGSLKVMDVTGDINIDDGSGSITMDRVGGNVEIEDGSGSITVTEVGADLSINDGSGSIKAMSVGGSVTVDDGSGSINVRDVEEDLIIVMQCHFTGNSDRNGVYSGRSICCTPVKSGDGNAGIWFFL